MKTVEKAFDILETVLNHGSELGLAQMAELTSLNRTTVFRLSSVLVKRGYLYQKDKGGKYSPGLKFLQYNNITNFGSKLKEQALPYLQNLCSELDETVNLAMLDGIKYVDIASVAAERILQVAPASANKLPLHCTAIGKVLLAYIPKEKFENIINIVGLKPFTDNTITDVTQLKKAIEAVRRDGIAFDDEEYVQGVKSVAAPVREENGNVLAAISLVAPSIRINAAKMKQVAPTVKSCALKISLSLGYKGE